MRVLLTGASGFIGSRLGEALAARGHTLVCPARDAAGLQARYPAWQCVPFEMTRALDRAAWLPLVTGADVVINAVGIFTEQGAQRYDTLHVRAPKALFDACAQARPRRVIQLSALGADAEAATAYHLSKRTADEHLLSLPLDAVVLQPSLVFGLGGASAVMLLTLAAAPLIVVPAGAGPVQPVHVDDLVALAVRVAEGAAVDARRIAVVGPRALALADYLRVLRAGAGLAPAPVWRVPERWVDLAARLAARRPGAWLTPPSWRMLRRGNVASAGALQALLGRAPRDPAAFIRPGERAIVRAAARPAPWLVLLRWSVAAVWIATAVVSFGVYPVEHSLALLARLGAHGLAAQGLLYGGAALNLLFGIATLCRPGRRLWRLQIGLVVLYTLLITAWLPEYWLHPYGPVLKNLPLLAALGLLHATEARP